MKLVENIYSNRLRIREISEKDTEAIVEWRNKKDVYIYFKYPRKITLKEHDEWLKNIYSHNMKRIDCIIEIKDDEKYIPIGTCGLSDIDIVKKRAEISYLLDEKYRGYGYASEAITALENFAVNKFSINRFRAIVHYQNKPSIEFVQKKGYIKKEQEDSFFIYEKTYDNV